MTGRFAPQDYSSLLPNLLQAHVHQGVRVIQPEQPVFAQCPGCSKIYKVERKKQTYCNKNCSNLTRQKRSRKNRKIHVDYYNSKRIERNQALWRHELYPDVYPKPRLPGRPKSQNIDPG